MKNNNELDENPYLSLGFLQFGIISTLMVVFFPWSLLFCVVFLGLDNTALLVKAMFIDFIRTILSILAIFIPLIIVIILLLFFLFG
jgi:hypothetical protein